MYNRNTEKDRPLLCSFPRRKATELFQRRLNTLPLQAPADLPIWEERRKHRRTFHLILPFLPLQLCRMIQKHPSRLKNRYTAKRDQTGPPLPAFNDDLVLRKDEKYTAPDAHIIIVDDTRTNLFVAASLLKRTRIRTDTAGSGAEFLEKAASVKYDIILIDYRMPGMNGIEAVSAMRSAGGINKDTVVVMMTADTDPSAEELFRLNNIGYTISKPLDPVYYEAYVAALLPADKVIYG